MSPPPKVAVLYLTHFIDDHVRRELARLREETGRPEDTYLLFHNDGASAPPPSLAPVYRISDRMIDELGFERMQQSIVPGHVVFQNILFARDYPEYDYYWLVEYDVRYTGHWGEFFAHQNQSTADLRTTHIRRFIDEPYWFWWQTFADPEQPIDIRDRLRSFNVIARYSKTALTFLDLKLSRGCQGHYEMLVPTLLHQHGYRLEDIGGSGPFSKPSARRCYSSITLHDGIMQYAGTLRHLPARERAGRWPNTLYHPVKPGAARARGTRVRLDDALRRADLRVQAAAWKLARRFAMLGGRRRRRPLSREKMRYLRLAMEDVEATWLGRWKRILASVGPRSPLR